MSAAKILDGKALAARVRAGLAIEAARLTARGVTPAIEPFDDSATHRLRILRGGAQATLPVEVRYRFSIVPIFDGGRLRVRFPAGTERLPPPADVTVRARGAADLDIAGVRATFAGNFGTAAGRASMRAPWEVSWATQAKAATEAPALDARIALAALSPDYREVIELHWFGGLSFPEVAEAVGSTVAAVKVRAHRGYVALRARLGDEAPDPDRIPDAKPTPEGIR